MNATPGSKVLLTPATTGTVSAVAATKSVG